MSVRSLRTPSYRLHKPTGNAVVTLGGKDIYLGRFGTPESRAEYDRLIAEWLSNGRHLPQLDSGADLTINELFLRFLDWAETYYRKNGEPTGEVTNIKYAVRQLRQLYGHTRAADFGPLALKAVRDALIGTGLCRNEVNRRTRIIVRGFKWGVENELVPPSVHHGLKAVSGLRRGRAAVRESEPVKPVPHAFVEAIRPHVSRQVWAMVQLQSLSGMRPGEVCTMRTCDLETSGKVWLYTPESHKTEHHGRERKIYLGPSAQIVLRPWLKTDLAAYLFSPSEATEEKSAARRENRKSPMTPSQRARGRKRDPRRSPGVSYTPNSLRHAIVAACKKGDVPEWHPNQLRHNAATRLRKEFGLDVARAVLGHSSPAVTEVYAEVDGEKARSVMESVG